MNSIKTLIISLSICFVTAQKVKVDRKCLDCICQASTGCYEEVGCIDGGGTKYCGPYLISWGYWFDGGSPGLNFERCAQNKTCAEAALQGYMKRYGKDCDEDGIIDCDDFARIHKRGYGDCNGNQIVKTDYMIRYEMCLTPNDEEGGEEPQPSEDYGDGLLQERVVGIKPE